MSAYTPGPWEAVLADDPRGQPQLMYRELVAIVSTSPRLSVVANRTATVEEWPGNAVLLAAAPRLLEAIRKALPAIPWHPDGCTWCPRCELEQAIRGLPEGQ